MSVLVGVLRLCVLGLLASLPAGAGAPAESAMPASPPGVAARDAGDPQRQRAWNQVARLAEASRAIADPFVAGWFPGAQVLPQAAARRAFTDARALQSGGEELIVFALYDTAASRHIRSHPLAGRSASAFPPFPDGSAILLAAWWPVARQGLSPLPVWDPADNPPNPAGNGYLTWKRLVAIDPRGADGDTAAVPLVFAGRSPQPAHRVPLDAFLHVPVDAALAGRLMRDARTRKAAVIALGRALQPGDALALVALHVIEKQDGAWTWATAWWHDRPGEGPFARDRPSDLRGPLRHYLMDQLRVEPGDAPGEAASRACFNPWFEARFPDGGEGGGIASTCIACHSRAGHPAASFLPVRRGVPGPDEIAAAGTRFTTDFIWSVPRSVVPPPRR